MRKLVLFVDCGTGTRSATAYLVDPTVSQEELDNFAWDQAVEHGQRYGIEFSDEDEDEDEDESYADEIAGWFEEYEAKKHDGQLKCGYTTTVTWESF